MPFAPLPDDLVRAYLARIGLDATVATDAAGLTALQRAHLRSVPFENLSIHLGEEIVLDEVALAEKVARRGRGGFCFEMNGAFGALLQSLGFAVELLEARVYGPPFLPPDQRKLGIRYDHLCLLVHLPEGPRLADVGFGASFAEPLAADATGPQVDPNGTFELVPVDDGWVDLRWNGAAQYCLDPRPRSSIAEFEPGRLFHTTSPDSPFTQRTVCSLPTTAGRVTVTNRTLITTAAGIRTEREVDDDAELLAIYRDAFGLHLGRLPTIPSS